jgi:hypothetical protein
MDRVSVTYQIDGTTRHMVVTGTRLAIQMTADCTIVQVSGPDPGDITEAHMFRHAEYIHVERNL